MLPIAGTSDVCDKIIEDGDMFDHLINEGKAVVYFMGNWCGPCRDVISGNSGFGMKEQLSEKGIISGYVDVDENRIYDKLREHNISAIPLAIGFQDGEEVGRIEGSRPPEEFYETVTSWYK